MQWLSTFSTDKDYQVPVCECGLHLTSRMRVGMINDGNRQSKMIRTLEKIVKKDSVCLNLTECSFLGHYLALGPTKKVTWITRSIGKSNAGLGVKFFWLILCKSPFFLSKVYNFETNKIFRGVLQNVAKFNNVYEKLEWPNSLDNIEEILQKHNESVNIIVHILCFSSYFHRLTLIFLNILTDLVNRIRTLFLVFHFTLA